MGGAKALREAPGRATDVAKTRSERSGKRRDGAKRKVSEGSCLRMAMMAVVQNRFGIYPSQKALQGTSIPKRFGTSLFRPLCAPPGFPDV